MTRTNRTFNDLGPVQRKFMLRAFNEGVSLDDPLATEKRTKALKDAGSFYQPPRHRCQTEVLPSEASDV